jgi:hypothetical protein
MSDRNFSGFDPYDERGSTFSESDFGDMSGLQRAQFKRMKRLQDGKSINNFGDRKNQRRLDREQRFESIASELELTAFQKQQVVDSLHHIDLQKLGYPMELVAFCVCILVARQDNRFYHPHRNQENNDRKFQKFAESLPDREQRLILRVLSKLEHRLRDIPYTRYRW